MADTSYKDRRKIAEAKYRSGDKYKETALKNHLKRKYNISLEQYKDMLEVQNHRCAVCGVLGDYRSWKDGRQQRIPFCVDHDHVTGNVRGLLCNKCNVAIALFNENIESLLSAINYLKESQHF